MTIFNLNAPALIVVVVAFVALALIGGWGITTFIREWKR
jgi:hypothetical protein